MDKEKIISRFVPMSETMFYILFALRQERHGYGIMQTVRELTKERIVLGAGTVYQSLGKLEGDRLIKATREEDRRKMYIITELGMTVLKTEAARIKEVYSNLGDLL